jgi:hypothetical protein
MSLCRLCLVALLSIRSVECLSAGPTPTATATTTPTPHQHRLRDAATSQTAPSVARRSILGGASSRRCFGAAVLVASGAVPLVYRADVADASSAPVVVDDQFAEVGRQERPPDGEAPFATLPGGVQIKDFRTGERGGPVVRPGSRVELTMKGRLLNLNGVIFYDTKSNDPNGFGEGTPLTFAVGDGSVLPGLEAGVIGMVRGGIRRIIVPSDVVGYGSFPDLEPRPFTDAERRALDSVIKNPRRDGTVMFDVKVERVR